MESRRFARMASPVGELTLVAENGALVRITFEAEPWAPTPGDVEDPSALAPVIGQLSEYFGGERREFEVAFNFEGTEFQKKVWRALVAVPFGETVSYGALARRVGSPAAARAVGAACGSNPLPLVIPCHRAVGSDGRLTGFGGGLDAKRWLLAHERGLAHEAARAGLLSDVDGSLSSVR
jgi:methylated-DNA-[protein]-cysteine S-methyltransferase